MAVGKKAKIAIRSGGRELREYRPPAGDATASEITKSTGTSNVVVKYIRGVADTNFEFFWAISSGFKFKRADYIVFKVSVDGEARAGPVCTATKYKDHGSAEGECLGPYETIDGRTTLRPFRWGILPTNEETCSAEEKQKYDKNGTIKVEVWRKKMTSIGSEHEKSEDNEPDPVPEKAVKDSAVDLNVRLDEPEVQTCNKKYWSGQKVEAAPYAVFVFKYRSKKALQSLGIIKGPKVPVPLEERDPKTLTRKELQQLAQRQKEIIESTKAKVKQEIADTNLAQLADLKRSRSHAEDDDEDEVTFVKAKQAKKTSIGPDID